MFSSLLPPALGQLPFATGAIAGRQPPTCGTARAIRPPGAQPLSTANSATKRSSGAPNGSSKRVTELYQEDWTPDTSKSITKGENQSAREDAGSVFLDDGWGVQAVTATAPSRAAGAKGKKGKKEGKRSLGSPYVTKDSEAGLFGLTLLQQRLAADGKLRKDDVLEVRDAVEAQRAVKRKDNPTAKRAGPRTTPVLEWKDPDAYDATEDEDEEVDIFAPEAASQQGMAGSGKQARGTQRVVQQQQQQGAETPSFQLSFEADGTTDYTVFDEAGNVLRSGAPELGPEKLPHDDEDDDEQRGLNYDDDDDLSFLDDEDDDEDGFGAGASSWGQVASASAKRAAAEKEKAVQEAPAKGAPAGKVKVKAPGLGVKGDEEERAALAARRASGRDAGTRSYTPSDGVRNALADEEAEWGLDELSARTERRSLLQEFGVIESKNAKKGKKEKDGKKAGVNKGPKLGEGDDDDLEGNSLLTFETVMWGGTGGVTGTDMDQQEALLTRLFKPHKVAKLMEHQRAADAAYIELRNKKSGRWHLESKMHSRLRIISGTAAGKVLASSQGGMTRPMMEKVRAALFSMVQSIADSPGALAPTARWLDLFAGTGAVGIEAISRGAKEAHFVELDPWVCKQVIGRNITTCGFNKRSVIHTCKAEVFLQRALDVPRFAGGAFDFISCCPPYLLVSYPELMDLLSRSPLLGPRTIVFVEYPKQLKSQMPAKLGHLVTARDRRYGRTWVRVFAPAEMVGNGGFDDDEDNDGEEFGEGVVEGGVDPLI